MNWIKKGAEKSVTECCLKNLGVSSTEEINEWFKKSRSGDYKIKDLDKAKDFLLKYRDTGTVVVCGDYDADGITATAICCMALKEAGFKDVKYKIPSRHLDGYGLNEKMVHDIALENEMSPVCILTVDNGIAAHEALDVAKNKYGFGVVVTDHHLGKLDKHGNIMLPKADVIIDPEALPGTADFSSYCGAGIAYKLAYELLGLKARKYMPLAAIATFADVVPLREENYVFARDGLRYLNKGCTPDGEIIPEGLMTLIALNGADLVTDQEVLYKIAPEINAPGRLLEHGANIVVNLLLLPKEKAYSVAEKIIDLNSERRKLADAGERLFMDDVKGKISDIYISYIPNINPGIVGIIAGRGTDKLKRPVIVFTDSASDKDLLVGSARSVGDVNIKELLDRTATHLEHYGGHEGAAGVTVKKENFNTFRFALQRTVELLSFSFNEPDEIYYDLEISVKDVAQVAKEIESFAPFGEANPAPVFKISDFLSIPYAGRYKEETKGGAVKMRSHFCSAIGFGMARKMDDYPTPKELSFIGEVSLNRFRGKISPQIIFKDFKVIEEEKVNEKSIAIPCDDESEQLSFDALFF